MTGVELSGAEALVAQLAREGVRHVFGVPGVQLDHALDALARSPVPIGYFSARHEQGAAHMADGYARATGQPGVCLVVPGPGLLNAMTALATGYACSSPMLCLAAQIPSCTVDRDLGMLHELSGQDGVLATVTKWSGRASSAAQIPELVHRAVEELRSGRARPVGLSIPADLLRHRAEMELVEPAPVEGSPAAPDPGDLEKIVTTLREARRPVIYAGSGVLAARAGDSLLRLAEAMAAPVVMSRNGKGAVPAYHPLAFPSLATAKLLGAADVVLVVGSRFLTGRGDAIPTAPGTTVILVNADPADLGPPRRAHLTLTADARLALQGLLAAARPGAVDAGPRGLPDPFWSFRRLAPVRAWCARQVEAVEPQWSFVRALREAIPDDGILVNELTQVGYVASAAYPVHRAGTFITPGYQGTLGYGYPTALGVKVGSPDKAVVSINGDGGFGYNMQELATARRYGIAVAAVVFNDNAYGNVKSIQSDEFDGRHIGWELANPDFVRMADAFGIPATRADSPDRLAGAVKDSLAEAGPVLIEVPVGDMPSPWPLLLGGPPSSVRG